MGSFALIAIVGGLLILLGLYLWARQRQRLDISAGLERALQDVPLASGGDAAVLVATEHGQLVHINDTARRWLGWTAGSPDLEYIAGVIEPSDSFLQLLIHEGQASFQLMNRWVEASSHTIPSAAGRRVVLVMRELSSSTSHPGLLDLSLAMTIVNEIGETVNASMGIEQVLQMLLETLARHVDVDAGEIALWDEKDKVLRQRGWQGETKYLLMMAESGGVYQAGEGVAGWIGQHRRPVLVANRQDPAGFRVKLDNNPYESIAAVPLMLGDRFIGTLALFSSQPDRFSQADLALLQAISKPVAISIYNTELYSRQMQRVSDLASLQKIAENSDPTTDTASIYRMLNERIAQLVESDMCGILLHDPDRRSLMPQLPFHGIPDNVAQLIVIPVPDGSPQHNIWRHQPHWVSNDVVDEPLIESLGLMPVIEVTGIRSLVLIPMQIGGVRIGTMMVCNRRTERGFSPHDIQNLAVLVAQAAIIVGNLRLYQREQRIDTELVGLQEMTHAIGALSHEGEFYQEISERIARLMKSAMCGVLLYDPQRRVLRSQLPFYGLDDALVRDYEISLQPGTVMEELWSDEDYWYSNRVASDPLVFEAGLDQLAEAVGVQKTLFAALSVGGRRIGVVQVSNRMDNSDYTDTDARLLQIFATQAAAIIENARLVRQVQRSAQQAESLRRLAEMAGSVLTTEESFAPILQEIAAFMRSPAVFINVLDHTTGSLITYPRWTYGFSQRETVVQDIRSEGFEHSVAVSGRPFMSNDLPNDRRVLPGYRASAQRFNLEKAVLVPLVVGDRILGELGVANRPDEPYTEDDLPSLSAVASQIAVALERLLLYEATGENLRRRMEELDVISRVSAELTLTVELDPILDMIRHEAALATGADGSSVALILPPHDWQDASQPEMERRLGDEGLFDGLCDLELETVRRGGPPVLVSSYDDSEWKAAPARANSAVAAPILYLDQVVGVIHLYHSEANRFDERAGAFLLTLATKASLGYQNAIRYREQFERSDSLRRRVDQLNRIFELGQMLQTNVDAVSVMEAIAYSVQQSVGYDVVLMLLHDERTGTLHRTAQAGMPLSAFEETRSQSITLERLNAFLKEQYRISESYFFPVAQVKDWYVEGISALSATYAGNRTLQMRGGQAWRDGDMLVVKVTGTGGNLIGLMSLDRPYDNNRPDRATIEVLEIFAHQAAAMIENARLFMESKRSAEQEARLNEVMEAVSSTLDLGDIVEAMAGGARQLVNFSQMSVAVADTQNEGYDLLRVSVSKRGKLSLKQDHHPGLERTALGRCVEERAEHIYLLDDSDTPEYEDLRSWQKAGAYISMVLPLVAGGECVGAVHLGAAQEESEALLEARGLLGRMVQLIASAIQNARLFTQAVSLQVLNLSVVESIQQGIVVLDNSARIININDFMRSRYGWNNNALRQDLFDYQPDLRDFLRGDLVEVLETGTPREHIGQMSATEEGEQVVRNFYVYPLRYGDVIRGAVLLVEDVTERALLEQAIETRANQLAALTEVSTRVSASLERDEVIALTIEEMAWIIPFEQITVWRRTGAFMVLEGSSGFAEAPPVGLRVRFKEHERLRQLVETQRVISVSSETGLEDEGVPGEAGARSWMGVPLVNQGHIVGVIVLTHNEANFYETRSEQHVAMAFASQVAIALANADLFEQMFDRTNELGTLLEAAQATSSSLNLDEVYRTVVELLFNALAMDHCTIMIWDDVDNELEVQIDMDRSGEAAILLPPGTRISLAHYPARLRALRQREVIPIVDRDIEDEAPLATELDEMRSLGYGSRILVPLVVREQSMGLIKLEQISSEEETVTQQKVRLARALGAQVAIAIENARLSTETTARFEELLTINALSQAISSTLNLDDLIKIVREQVPNVTDADELYLALYSAETGEITFPLAVSSGQTFEIPPRQFGKDEVSYIIRNRHSLSLGADYFSLDELRRSMGIINGEGDVKSYLGVPLIAGDEVFGVLAIRDKNRTRAFDVNNERILTTVASQLGAALQNSRLFEQISSFASNLNRVVEERTLELEEERDRLDTLYQITSELARTLDMERLLDRALGMVCKAVAAEDGVVLLSDPVTDRLFSRAVYDPASLQHTDEEGRPMHPAEELATWLIRNAHHDPAIVVEDLHQADFWDKNAPGAERWRSALAVLLEMNEDPMGVMVLFSSRPGAFTELHLKLLVAAASQVASAINNADLYQLIRDQAERLGTLLRAEQEEAERSTAILESIADGVLLANSRGVIILFNTAAERILQLSRDQLLGQPLSSLTSSQGGAAARWVQSIEEWMNNPHAENVGGFIDERFEFGERIVSVHLSPVYIGSEFLGTVSVFRDITKDVEVDRIKSEFITNVSHEFRTPLTPIKGFTDILLMGAVGALTPSQAEMLQKVRGNVERLTTLVNDVLNIAKLDSHDERLLMQMVDLHEMVPGIVKQIAERPENVRKQYTSSVEIEENVPSIRADHEKLIQIISNVVDNAFKYTRAGGNIGVRVSLQPDGRSVLIAVQDTGVGIPEEFREAIWRRFERYEEHALELDVAGTGLGLPLVKGLVERHQGDVWFESELGKGTTFFIRLPVEQPGFITETIEMVRLDSKAGD